jgi:hypothetical protein
MATHTETIELTIEGSLSTIRDAYVAAVNAALENGRDQLAEELAAEYAAEYPQAVLVH